jgi:hypothetical protein
MIRNITKYIPLTTLFVCYFFICGGLYLTSFWTTMDIDITSFITLSDIPKSFILPFIASQAFALVYNALFSFINLNFEDINTPKKSTSNRFYRLIKNLFSYDIFILLSMLFLILKYDQFKYSIYFWLFACLVFPMFIISKLVHTDFLKHLIVNYGLRYYMILTLVSIPFISVLNGKLTAIAIYKNNSFKIASIKNYHLKNDISDSVALKFIGFIGNKLIISSLDNKKIIIINQASIEKVELRNNK